MLAFEKAFGVPLALLALAVGFVAWIYKPDSTVPLYIFISFLSIFFILLAVLVTLTSLYEDDIDIALKINNKQPGRIIRANKNLSRDLNNILMVEPHSFFSVDTEVEIFHFRDDKFEVLIGRGNVRHIQMDGFVQVEIVNCSQDYISVWNDIWTNNVSCLDRTSVKPITTVRKRSNIRVNTRPPLEIGHE